LLELMAPIDCSDCSTSYCRSSLEVRNLFFTLWEADSFSSFYDEPLSKVKFLANRGRLYLSCPGIHTILGLLAHMSTLACSKVMEETKLFPDVLCSDLLSRITVWPKSFMNCGPNDDSIALYFILTPKGGLKDKLTWSHSSLFNSILTIQSFMVLQCWEVLWQVDWSHDVQWPRHKSCGWNYRSSNFSFCITPYPMLKWVILYFIELFSVALSKFIVRKTKLYSDSIEFLVLQDFKKSTTCGGVFRAKKIFTQHEFTVD